MNNGRPPVHTIIYGDPTGGKTTCLTTYPKPMLVFFFDAMGKDGPYLKWARRVGATIVDEVAVDSSGQQTVPRRVMTAPNGDSITIEYYNDLNPESWAWYHFEDRISKRYFLDEGYVTVGVDSITFMELAARMYQKFVVNPKSKEPRQWFAGSTDSLEYTLLVQLNALPCNVVVLAHIDSDKDELHGVMIRNPAAPGRLTSRNLLSAGYSELYRAYVQKGTGPGEERAFLLQTMPDSRFNCATQIGAPDPSWQDYESLWDGWDKGEV